MDALKLFLADEAATARLGEDLAAVLRRGDVLALHGDLGAGKSTLARALIRALAGDENLEVPSPTFTLVQTYPTGPTVAHFDLYRLGSADELDELGFEDAARDGAVLVEWPEKAGERLPTGALTVALAIEGKGRRATLDGEGTLFERARRSLEARNFLEQAGWGEATRRRLTGDASARSYETVSLSPFAPRLLMNSPPLVLGPLVKNGKAYAEIARSARSVHAFAAVDEALAAAGFGVPQIFAADVENGFLLVENLGRETILDDQGRPLRERYEAAAELLAALHGRRWAARVETKAGFAYDIPPFDREALMIEVGLLLDWFVPFRSGEPASPEMRRGYEALWAAAFDRLEQAEKSLVLRDYHSPNIIWRPERSGLDRLGLIDFQDALIGPAAYDVASVAMDARVTVPPELEAQLVGAYERAREKGNPGFDKDSFRRAYAIAAAQRNSKILGIFVRLKERDGKDGYIRHLPRIQDYLSRALAHPALAEMRNFYRRHGFLENGG